MTDSANNDPVTDPIIEEVRRNRESLFREAGGTLEKLCERLKEAERRSGAPVVRLEPRRPRPGDSDAA